MELFKLVGKLAIEGTAEAKQDVDDVADKAEKSESKISEAFKKIGKVVVTYLTVDKIVSFGKECVNMASDVEEMENKFNVVFDGMQDDVDDWATTFASSIGRNKNTIKGYLADNQNMFVGMGMTREEGAKLSEQMVSLALDLASFNNLNETDAVNAFSKAIMGETESAKSLGAVLNDNTRAMAMEQLGYEGKYDALTEAQKMEVNYQAILMQSADAVGDCERSLDSYKGKTIQLQSAKEELYETIGTMLLPIMTELVGKFTEIVTWIQSVVEWSQEHQTAVTLLAVAIGTITTAIIAYNVAQNAAAIATGITTAATTAFSAVMAFLTSPITLVITAIGLLVAAVYLLVKNWEDVKEVAQICWEAIKGAFEKAAKWFDETVIQPIAKIFSNLWSNLKNGASNAWKAVKNVFNSVATWFGNIFKSAWNSIKNAFSPMTEFFSNIWTKIKETFSKVGEVVGNAITNTVKSAINAVLSTAVKIINGFISAINFAISVINAIPGVSIDKLDKLDVPQLAEGGVLEKGQVGLLEGNGAEAVVPLDENRKWIAKVAEDMRSETGAGMNDATLEEILDVMKQFIKVLPDTLVNALVAGVKLDINNREFARLVKVVK